MRHIYFFTLILWGTALFAQAKLPVIKATSKHVAINDGGYLDKNAWTLSPGVKPDIFTADRTRKTKWVTFYTDIDSIKIKVKPGTIYNFVIVLNGKDSCYTQVVSAVPPGLNNSIATHDTIPFTLTGFNAIGVEAVINGTDTLRLHFDVGSFDFRLTKDAILKKTKLLAGQPAFVAGEAKPDYNNLSKVFKVQMGSMVWQEPVIVPTGTTAREMDGRFGWNLFEGKKVEIDYDHSLLIIHSKLPKAMKGYTSLKIDFIHSFVCVKGSIEVAHKKYTGSFLLDTGSDQAIILDSAWAGRYGFNNSLRLIRSSVLSDPRGVKYEAKVVLAPMFRLNTFELPEVPAYILGGSNPVGFEVNYLGNDLLKRFNMILDFEHDKLYLKPNKLLHLKYREST